MVAAPIPSDISYPTNLYFGLRDFESTDSAERAGAIQSLQHVLVEMIHRVPFRPAWRSDQPRPELGPNAEFEYRQPVWDAIAEAAVAVDPLLIHESPKERAIWLSRQLELYVAQQRYETVLKKFVTEMKAVPASVHVGQWVGGHEPDVVITGSFKPRAEAAQKVVEKLVKMLIPSLEPK